MRKDLTKILVCPICKESLDLSVDESKDGEVISGHLICTKCPERYPIVDAIPDLMPPDLRQTAAPE